MTLTSYLSIITLNINGFRTPIKGHRVSGWIKKGRKQDPLIFCLEDTHFRPKDTTRLKVRGWRTIYHANGYEKKPGVAILEPWITGGPIEVCLASLHLGTMEPPFPLYSKRPEQFLLLVEFHWLSAGLLKTLPTAL